MRSISYGQFFARALWPAGRAAACLLALAALVFVGPAHAAKSGSSSTKTSSPPPKPTQQSSSNKASSSKSQPAKPTTTQKQAKDDDDDDDRSSPAKVAPVKQTTQQTTPKQNKKDDDDDDDDNKPSTKRTDATNPTGASSGSQSKKSKAAAAAEEANSTPPDNLVEFLQWVSKPAIPAAPPQPTAPLLDGKGLPSLLAPAGTSVPGWTAQVKPAVPGSLPVVQGQGVLLPGTPTPGSIGQAVRATTAQATSRGKGIVGKNFLDGQTLPPPQQVLGINLSDAAMQKARSFAGAGPTLELPSLQLKLTPFSAPQGQTLEDVVKKLVSDVPGSDFAPNHQYRAYDNVYRPQRAETRGTVAPTPGSGCLAERCFGPSLIRWQPELSACGKDIKVGIIDTGFDLDHPTFAGQPRPKIEDFRPSGSKPASALHGTSVLSMLAGKSLSSTPGLLPEAKYYLAVAFHADGDGQPVADTLSLIKALDWLKREGVDVVNLSLAGPKDDLVGRALRIMSTSGVVLVAAAGNDGPLAPPSYPAAYREVIAVTAVDRRREIYSEAGQGKHIDLSAPGVEIWAAMPGNREGLQTGTSFAAPFVTAVVAASLSKDAPAPQSKDKVLAELRTGAKDLGERGRDNIYGHGLVQAPAQCGGGDTRTPVAGWDSKILRATVGLASTLADPGEDVSKVSHPSGGSAAAGFWDVVVKPALGR